MIQIDMPMPTNCLDCPACNEYLTCAIPVNGRKWGENDVREFGQGRPEWCPLKEQEAVAPYQHDAVWLCGNCEKEVVGWDDDIDGREYRYPFCRQCGKAVKWE